MYLLCVFRLFEDRLVSITAVVGADDMFSVGLKNRCDIMCDDVIVRSKNLGELKWYGGYHYSKDRKKGTLTISNIVKKFRVTSLCGERSTWNKY